MPIYKIADLNLKISPKTNYVEQLLKPYIVGDSDYSDEITITESDIEYEKSLVNDMSFGLYESTAILRKISKLLSENYNGIMLHSAAIKFNNKAYLFTAPSGTGKTTHINLWKKYFNDVEIINGDKPLLRNIQGKIIVYGTPWNGKENYGSNICAELGGIFILQRGEKNSAKRISPLEALTTLLRQTPVDFDRSGVNRVLDWFDIMFKTVHIYLLKCNVSEEAVKVAKACIETENE